MNRRKSFIWISLFICLGIACREEYNPDAIQPDYNFLVVDGIINTGVNAITTITLNRTRRLNDAVSALDKESNASVVIEGESGVQYLLTEQAPGTYKSAVLNLSPDTKYRLRIKTSSGSDYASLFVKPLITQPIDSVTWEYPGDVNIYVNTHDPTGQSRYYRWSFEETWQYRSFYEGIWIVKDNYMYIRDSSEQVYDCWVSTNSETILLGTTVQFSEDRVTRKLINTIPKSAKKLGVRYSILVQQYALSKEAYEYWLILQKNTEQLGTIFDAQPAQLIGNIQSLSSPGEPVIGYISAGSSQEMRVFIERSSLQNWGYQVPGASCDTLMLETDPMNRYYYSFPDTNYAPFYFKNGDDLIITRKICLDCRYQGGTNLKPVFW